MPSSGTSASPEAAAAFESSPRTRTNAAKTSPVQATDRWPSISLAVSLVPVVAMFGTDCAATYCDSEKRLPTASSISNLFTADKTVNHP
jgi:hypothetical protein